MIVNGSQDISPADVAAVARTLRSNWLTQGPKVREFEKKLARSCGARYAVAVNSGTAALHLAYLAAGIGKGDEVITTPNTFAATANMLMAAGARPVFCDIRLDTYNIDEKKVEKLITKKTKAIVPVHFAGHPAEMNAILRVAKKHKLLVIEDACHALGATYKGKKAGSLGSDMAVFSFHPVKPITTGEGGAVVTDSKKYYEKLMLLRNHGIRKDTNGFNVMMELGYNYRMNDIAAALGASQLRKLNDFLRKRREVVEWYRRELKSVDEIILPQENKLVKSGWHLFVIRVKNPGMRLSLYRYLRKKGIGVSFHYPAVYSHPFYRRNGYRSLSPPNEEAYHRSCITLPLHTKMTFNDVRYISGKIKLFLK